MAKPYYLTRTQYDNIGKRGLRRKDGLSKASGRALFTRDISLFGMTYAKQLLSPFSHARILSIDKSKAESLQGVLMVITVFEPLGQEGIEVCGLDYQRMKPFFGSDTAHRENDGLGVYVIAETEKLCDEALRLLEIEWEELPFVVEYKKALEPGAPLLRPDLNPDNNVSMQVTIGDGDVEAGFAEASNILEFNFVGGENAEALPEGGCCVARWDGDQLELWTHTQFPETAVMAIPDSIAKMCSVHMHHPYQGGHFGNQNASFHPFTVTAWLSKQVGRPLKMFHNDLTWHENSSIDMDAHVKVGFKDDGTILAVDMDKIGEGFVGNEAWMIRCTSIPNVSLTTTKPFMNRVIGGCMKEGGEQCSALYLTVNQVANALNMDPTDVALKNDGSWGRPMHPWVDENIKVPQGFPLVDSLAECLKAGKEAIGWDEKKHAPGAKILPNGKYHGLGFGYFDNWTWQMGQKDGSSLAVGVRLDGSVGIYTLYNDQGVCGPTAYCQIVADELGMKYEDVDMSSFEQNGLVAFDDGCSGGLITNGNAAAKAARMLKKQILELATTDYEVVGFMFEHPRAKNYPRKAVFSGLKPEDLDIKDSMVYEKANPANKATLTDICFSHGFALGGQVALRIGARPMPYAIGHGYYADTGGNENEGLVYMGPPSEGYYCLSRMAHFVEIEIDPDTGQIDIVDAVHVHDVGKAINLDACEITGGDNGSWMMLSRCVTEDCFYDPVTGVRLNEDHIQFPIFLLNDIKSSKNIILENGLGYGPYGSTGVSEPANCSSFLLVPAIYNAIGEWFEEIPVTPEKILKALGKV